MIFVKGWVVYVSLCLFRVFIGMSIDMIVCIVIVFLWMNSSWKYLELKNTQNVYLMV